MPFVMMILGTFAQMEQTTMHVLVITDASTASRFNHETILEFSFLSYQTHGMMACP